MESQQEPKLLTFYSQDESMANSYAQDRDLYATIASISFGYPYEDCLEFYPEGIEITYKGKKVITGHKTHTNEEGKKRRSSAKSILLGICYGRGAASIAEQIGKSTKEAQQIIDKFYAAFPTVKEWSDKTVEFAKKNGYVETWYGRRRYIKDIQLPEYTFELINSRPQNFNPLSFDENETYSTEVCEEDKQYYTNKLNKCYGYMEKQQIKQSAEREGIRIHDNSGKVAEAVRQCVNSRIQGGAADMTKRAMLKIYNNQEMRDLGFRLLIGVHDELIGECPRENAKRCAELLEYCMCTANEDIIKIKQKCDVEVSECWYGESIEM